MSPIGNPQNLLVSSLGGIDNPFITFFKYLFLPTILNLLVAYLLLRLFYRRHFNQSILNHQPESIKDPALANLCRAALLVIIVMIGLKIMAVFILPDFDFRLTYIALAGALPILLLGKRRLQIVKNIDWPTLVFFTAMFILMSSVWNAGIFQDLIDHMNLNVQDSSVIMGISVVLSQFISNVPLVALYLPMLSEGGVEIASLMALAAGSTIAGNLTILGAASNIIIIQNAEHKAQLTITFWQFVRIGAPLTLVNLLIYWLFLQLL
jgi:Na+/H+ antiporter NhaD/arsenite permease-like protein